MNEPAGQSDPLSPRKVTWLGLVVNAALAAGKILAGVWFASQAILADGVHSLTDLVTDVAVLIGLSMGDRPADDCHPYGHRRVHTLVAMLVGVGLLAAAGGIGYRALQSLRGSVEAIRGPWPLVLAVLTIPLKEILFRLTRAVGRRVGNPAILANAWHHRTDALTSLAAAAGLAGAMFAGHDWRMLDGITAAVISAFLLVTACKLILSAAGELVDRAPAAQQIDRIDAIVAETDGVCSHHAVRARKLGGKVEMDLHVQVDPKLTVAQGHDIASLVRKRIFEIDETVQEVIVHIEPATSPSAGDG